MHFTSLAGETGNAVTEVDPELVDKGLNNDANSFGPSLFGE